MGREVYCLECGEQMRHCDPEGYKQYVYGDLLNDPDLRKYVDLYGEEELAAADYDVWECQRGHRRNLA